MYTVPGTPDVYCPRNPVGSLATGDRNAFRNAFMNAILAGATSGRGGQAGSLAEGVLVDAANQPVPNTYTCPR